MADTNYEKFVSVEIKNAQSILILYELRIVKAHKRLINYKLSTTQSFSCHNFITPSLPLALIFRSYLIRSYLNLAKFSNQTFPSAYASQRVGVQGTYRGGRGGIRLGGGRSVDTYTGSHLVWEVLEGGEGCGSHALLAAIRGARGKSRWRHDDNYLWDTLASKIHDMVGTLHISYWLRWEGMGFMVYEKGTERWSGYIFNEYSS